MKKKYFVGWIASAIGELAPFVYSTNKSNVEYAINEWNDRETKVTHVSERGLLQLLLRSDVQVRGLKKV